MIKTLNEYTKQLKFAEHKLDVEVDDETIDRLVSIVCKDKKADLANTMLTNNSTTIIIIYWKRLDQQDLLDEMVNEI